MIIETVTIRRLPCQHYSDVWQAMRHFTQSRQPDTLDEIWVLQHFPVFTQGQNGKSEHILNPGDIPIIPVDRGGQVTYHGPGQCVVYVLLDMKRKKFTIRDLVTRLEMSVIQLLAEFNLTANAKRDAPGVYIGENKICSIGLRVRRGCSYHGIALNVAMDLEPFSRINPCGFSGLKMTQILDFVERVKVNEIEDKLIPYLLTNLGYTRAFDNSTMLAIHD